MAIKDLIKRALGYRLGASYLSEMAIPPGWNYQRYLEIYGEVGWLFGAVSLIANTAAATEWMAYQQLGRGKTKDLEDHIILDLLDHPNPFQSRYQFMLLLYSYLGLIGEAFIVIDFNRLKVPGQLWLAPPGFMNVVASPTEYISHYEYKKGNQTLRLEIPEVIHIMDANPANPYRGIGAAHAVSTDIDAEYYASHYQQRLFYNDATPGLIMEFPETPPAEERKQLREEFLETHQGWRNARKPAFLWGGAKANVIALSPKDMEYKELRNANKKVILAAYHISERLFGSETGSRAAIEADEYVFGKYTINPALMRVREALNEGLCTLYDDTLKLTYTNPVPADVTAERTNNREDFRAGIITREEARLVIGLDAEAESGQTYLLPFSVIDTPAKMIRSKQYSRLNDEQKEAYWRGYVAKTEGQEKAFIQVTKSLWDKQEKEVNSNLESGTTPGTVLFNEQEAMIEFQKAYKPLITLVFESALKDSLRGHEPEPVHTEGFKQDWLLNEAALRWIAERSLTLAKLLNGTTIEQLRATLAEGFAAGESIIQLRNRIEEYYTKANRVRATMTARTEVIAASNAGNLEGYKELGAEKKEWYTALDERTRDTHIAAHGQIVGINEDFKVGAGSGPAPGQIGLPEEDINCRCVILSVTD